MPTLSKSLSLGAPIPLTTSSILVVLGGLALAYAVVRAIHLAFFGDLAKIPGPLICKFTGLVDTYQTLVGARRSTWIHSLHLKYGPIVRISPTLVAIASPEELKTVYGGKFAKSQKRYRGKTINGHEHMLILKEPKAIKARRSILLPLFQKSNLENMYPDLQRYTTQFLNQIVHEQQTQGNVDFFRWFRLIAFDIIGNLAYGVDMAMTASGKGNALVELMAHVFVSFVARDFIPAFTAIQSTGLIPSVTALKKAEVQFHQYGATILDDMLRLGQISDVADDEKPNLLKSLYRASKEDPAITESHVTAEAGVILIAGSDTTSTAMTYGCYELSKNAKLQEAIREELRTVTEDEHSWATLKDLESLPLFNAFLKETLRLWPTLPGPLERSVPEGGAFICGKFLPAGAEVTMTAYSVHRDPVIFPDGETFKPERWLEETSAMRNAFIPFSYGPRNCVGMNLAWAEMRLVLGTLIRRYKIMPDPSTNAESVAPVEHFFVVPKAMHCKLRIEALDN